MMDIDENLVLETINLLEPRLERVCFLLTGRGLEEFDKPESVRGGSSEDHVSSRLKNLDAALVKLSATSRVARDLLRLCTDYFS